MGFIDRIKERAKQDKKTIVLPESMDRRTWEAVEIILKEGIANIIVLGTPEECAENSKGLDVAGATVIDPHTAPELQAYIDKLTEMGFIVRGKSKWLNCVWVECPEEKLEELKSLSFVDYNYQWRQKTEKPTAKERLEALHNLLEKAKVWDKNITDNQGLTLLGKVLNEAESLTEDAEQFMPVVMLLQRKIQQFYGHLRIVDLDEVSERQIRTDFLALSMMMIDVMESISNPNYIEALQGINLKLLKEEITLEEATGLTSPVTFLDVETPVWAQKLFKSIEKWAGSKDEPLIENRPYLLNGLRFEFNNQKQNGL